MYSLVYTNLCKQEISLVKGYKDEKLNKKQKIVLYSMIGLLALALAYTLVKKAEFDYHVKEARDDVEYYEGNDEGYYLSEANLHDKLESTQYGFTPQEIDQAVVDEEVDFDAVAYNAALTLLKAGYPLDGISIIMKGDSSEYGHFTNEQVSYAIQKLIDNADN